MRVAGTDWTNDELDKLRPARQNRLSFDSLNDTAIFDMTALASL